MCILEGIAKLKGGFKMLTENDVVIKKIRKSLKRDWKLLGHDKQRESLKALILGDSVVKIDARYTTHA
jgi:hypothetical protein